MNWYRYSKSQKIQTPTEIQKNLAPKEHFQIECINCGKIFKQCRCSGGPNGKNKYYSLCPDCGGENE